MSTYQSFHSCHERRYPKVKATQELLHQEVLLRASRSRTQEMPLYLCVPVEAHREQFDVGYFKAKALLDAKKLGSA